MFFNIYNLVFTIFRFIFRFFFFLKFLTPYFYSNLNNFLNSKNSLNQNNKIFVSKLSVNNLSKNKFNNVYKVITNLNENRKNTLINWYIFKRILSQNNSTLSVNESLFLFSYFSSNESNFSNIKLLSHDNFFSFKKINLSINKLAVSSRKIISRINNSININNVQPHNKIKVTTVSPKVRIVNLFKNWAIKFNSTSIDRLLSTNQIYNILFIRNFKVFNKGRYSRNRQYYRTGVYWCLYVNIVAVVGMYYWFYRFTMNFGYLWWLFYFFILTFFFSKFVKYNFININQEVNQTLSWLGSILENIYLLINNLLLKWLFRLIVNNSIYLLLFKNIYPRVNNFLISIYMSIIRVF
jgi:hypothetical protein